MTAEQASVDEPRPQEHTEPPNPTDPLETIDAMRQGMQRCTQLWRTMVSTTVTTTQFRILHAIAVDPGVDQNTVARTLHVDSSTVTAVVTRLLERGHVSRRRNTEDGRRKQLYLTAVGQKLHDDVSERTSAMTSELFAAVSGRDQHVLRTILRALDGNAEDKRTRDVVEPKRGTGL